MKPIESVRSCDVVLIEIILSWKYEVARELYAKRDEEMAEI